MQPIGGILCSICGESLPLPFGPIDPAATLCGLCRRLHPPYVKATAYGSYESGLRELIHLLKYERVRPAANVLGRMLAEAIADLRDVFQDARVLVVPVPLHARKQRQRGRNQAELIARAAVKHLADGRFEMGAGILERRRETQSQIGLSSHQRRENIRGAFAVTQSEAIAGRGILLVDDVFTTGTTASECARVLRRAGAAKVYVATVARTLKYEAQHVELKPAMPAAFTMAAAG
jgi:ComF family protein